MPEDILNINLVEFDKIKEFRCSKTALELLLLLKDSFSFSESTAKLDIDENKAMDILKDLDSQGVLSIDSSEKKFIPEKKNRDILRRSSKSSNFFGTKDDKVSASAQKNSEHIGKALFSFLESTFSLALGPIAGVVIDDEIADMGENKDSFPLYRFAELVGFLAHHIPREDKKLEFQKIMMNKIKELS